MNTDNLVDVDLHAHTTFSDGALTPDELLSVWSDIWVEVASVTDHDTMRSYEQADREKRWITLIPGIEITTHYREKTLHLLAYWLDHVNTDMLAFLDEQRKARRERAIKITELLNQDLIKENLQPIEIGEILRLEVEWPITRPDIARYLLAKWYVQTFDEAFTRWLRSYEVPLWSGNIYEVLWRVKDNGWISILAHPFAPYVSLATIFKTVSDQVNLLHWLKKWGLDGFEWFFSDQTPFQSSMSCEIASEWFLLTGWSDFHGGWSTSVRIPWVKIPWYFLEQFLNSVSRG